MLVRAVADEEEAARRAAMLATQSAQADAAIQKQTEDIGMLIANMTAAFSGFQQARVESLDAEVARRAGHELCRSSSTGRAHGIVATTAFLRDDAGKQVFASVG